MSREPFENLEVKHLGQSKYQAEKSLCLNKIGVLGKRAGRQCGWRGRAGEKVGRQGCCNAQGPFRAGLVDHASCLGVGIFCYCGLHPKDLLWAQKWHTRIKISKVHWLLCGEKPEEKARTEARRAGRRLLQKPRWGMVVWTRVAVFNGWLGMDDGDLLKCWPQSENKWENQRMIPQLPLIKVGYGGTTPGQDANVHLSVLPLVLLLSWC